LIGAEGTSNQFGKKNILVAFFGNVMVMASLNWRHNYF